MKRLALLLMFAAGTLACGGAEEPKKKADATPVPHDPQQPMAQSGFHVEWGTPGVPCALKTGAKQPVSVVVKNTGDQFWPNLASTASGKGSIRLAYRWWLLSDNKKPAVDYTRLRGDLRGPIAPGGSTMVTIEVVAPSTPGAYLLQLDLVEELVTWFELQGAAKLVVPVTVS